MATTTIAAMRGRLERGSVGTSGRVGPPCENPDKAFTGHPFPDNGSYMSLAILGSIFIVLGLAALAAGIALPIAYGLRLRAAARPSPRTLHRAPAAQVERVSA